jgi:hypothetical protein
VVQTYFLTNSIRVSGLRLQEYEDGSEVSAQVDGLPDRREPLRVWFRFSGLGPEQIALSGDPFIPALLPAAMWFRMPIVIEGDVSERLLAGVPQIMTWWSRWERRMRPVEIHAGSARHGAARGRGIGCFFTAGVDSFYTLLENLATETGDSRVTHLLFFQGHPGMALENEARYRPRQKHIEDVAREFSLNTVFGSTNAAEIAPGITADWPIRATSNLIGPGLCLAPLLRRLIVSAAATYDAPFPQGNHPLTDPMWSTGEVQVVHQGGEASRSRKIQLRIRDSDSALAHLAVCGDGYSPEYNCGRCEKCVRTMIALRAYGVLDRCQTLPHEISLAHVRNLNFENYLMASYLVDNLAALEATGSDPELAATLRDVLKPHPLRWMRSQFVKWVYDFDRFYLQGSVRRWARARALAEGRQIELSANPFRWLLSRTRRISRD